jgi:hypothetical protein
MPYLSLTDFVDVVSKAGSPKATKVSQIKNREKYSPATDFYKSLREGIVNIHESCSPKAALKEILGGLTDKKKIANYPLAIDGYKKWWGNKAFSWFNPPNAKFSKHGFDISVNPELGLEFNGQRHVIKLYLKDEKLTKFRVDLITGLMKLTLSQSAGNGTLMSVLDARSSKLFTSSSGAASLEPMIDAELSYIAALWPHL